MKKFLLLLVAFFALTASALATDIDIGASSIVGFNSANATSDTPLTGVSVTLGNPSVTCSSCLPVGAVGLSGLKVTLDGQTYEIAATPSRSAFTLTTNYAGSSGTATGTLWKFVHLRIYVTSPFVPAGSTTVIQSGTQGTTAWYRRYGVSIINDGAQNVAYIPAINDLPATTDSSNQTTTYIGGLYTQGGGFMQSYPGCVDEWQLSHSTTPTSWAQICSFNATPPTPPNPPLNYLTAAQINARFPSCLINNLDYFAATGNVKNCLTLSSEFAITGGILSLTNPAVGYDQIQEEGSNLAKRRTLNFIGSSAVAADDVPNLRTNLTFDSDLNALASNSTNGFWARTGAGTGAARTLQQPAAGITISNPAGTAGDPTFALANDLAGLEGLASTGGAYRTGTDTWANRTLTQPAAGITITNPAGVAGNPTFALANDLAGLEGLSSTGGAYRTGADTWANRTLQPPAAGITITNPAGIAGDPTFALANDLAGVEGLSTNGIATRTAANTWTTRTVTGTTNQVTLTNGDGVAGNPTVSLPTTVFLGTPGGSPAAGILKGPDASGTNIAGADLALSGGPGTGNAVPGQLAARYPLISGSGTTVQSLSTDRFPLSTSLYTNTTTATAVSNTVAETSIFTGATASSGSTLTIQGGSARAGTALYIRIYGAFNTTGTPTIQFRVKLGSVVVANTNAVTSGNNSAGIFFLDCIIYINAVGSSGLVRGVFEGKLTTALAGAVTPIFMVGAAGEPTVDFTADQTIGITAQWGTASASNNLQLISASIQRIR